MVEGGWSEGLTDARIIGEKVGWWIGFQKAPQTAEKQVYYESQHSQHFKNLSS